ncbi:MAG: acyltransferase domain-containing protein, partial [Anaerolineaceae bacterium]|nr:acyltransferase domain-containing protein [Anaerolineaceae bacterium]
MSEYEKKAVAVVGLGAIMPDAFNVPAFWNNIKEGKYSITDVPFDRWDPDDYYDPDPTVPNKTYSKLGAWVKGFHFNPLDIGVPIPPKVLAVMDPAQQWAIASSYQALQDYGYPERPLDNTRTAVILGNTLAGENHYITTMRIRTPEFMKMLASVSEFQSLPGEIQKALLDGVQNGMNESIANITEDTMPGELANIIAGRVANVFNFGGPNYVTDAACASTFAALQGAIDGLVSRRFDAVLTGGVDRNMGIEAFVKFCKIGALSPDGSRPYAEGANGFIMGEGAGVFLLKRLQDAERDGDKIYAVIRGIGGSSDGKGKGITAPNPIGQQRAIERAWLDAGMSPAEASFIEGHGTSTRVGDLAELQGMAQVFEPLGIPAGKVHLGSVKSNIGHLKSAAGAAGLLKTIGSINSGVISPTVNFLRPNPQFDFSKIPFYVNREAHPWKRPESGVRRAGVSSFGFGGTNFHVVIEEYLPGLLTSTRRVFPAVKRVEAPKAISALPLAEMPLFRGLLFLSAETQGLLQDSLNRTIELVRAGDIPESRHPTREELAKPERLVIDYEDRDELLDKAEKALKAFVTPRPNVWKMLTAQGIFRGTGKPEKVAFLFPGQGSQYVNMLRELCDLSPIVSETFREADEVMQPLLDGRTLTSYIFIDGDEDEIRQATEALRDTKITQPAVLTVSVALMRLLASYGFTPDVVVGHSLGEYAALVNAGVLSFADALVVVSARGRAMDSVSMGDNGCMAAVSAPIENVENILADVPGYVVIANINSPTQSVIGGVTGAVDAALAAFNAAGYEAVKIPVSHAFHTNIVAPASGPMRETIALMGIKPPNLPVIANVTGEVYPTEREDILDMLAKHVASPVQFVKCMRKLYEMDVRIFLEVGPKRVLSSLANDNLKEYADISILYSNHPRKGTLPTFNEALCGLYAAGVQPGSHDAVGSEIEKVNMVDKSKAVPTRDVPKKDGRLPLTGSVVISGAGLGLPGRSENVFSDDNFERILSGDMRIEPLPESKRAKMLEKRVTRLVKSDAGAEMVLIDDIKNTIGLAGQRGAFDLIEEFGVPAGRVEALDISTQLAIAAGIEALRDAKIPLIMGYRRTSKGTYLPDHWMLPKAMADETGVIFASAFPGLDSMSAESERFYNHRNMSDQLAMLRQLRAQISDGQSDYALELERRISVLDAELQELDYHFNRKFVFRVLPMGHSQFAEFVGARGPNTHVNAACASTTHAIAIAEDWIRAGRCRRVIIVSGDDITSGSLTEWVGTGLLATGAATTNGVVQEAAMPFDRRRNGMIMGMGAAALVVESQDSVEERGVRAICEVLASQIANSAFHGTRLDVEHVSDVMGNLLTQAEQRFAIRRDEIAPRTMFMSHETYTPARGGSAAAEIRALRQTFGDTADEIIISNTKGYTGHTMGVGIEEVLAVKALQYQVVPPIANISNGFEPDPELGTLNLSRGGKHPVDYVLRLGAGFGSQIALTLLRRIPGEGDRVDDRTYQRWLSDMSGYEQVELELVKRTLRVRDEGHPVMEPAKSKWQLGQGPVSWAPAVGGSAQIVVPEGPPSTKVALEAHDVEIEAPRKPVQAGTQAVIGAGVNIEQVKIHVLGLVSEKTGYPREMLELDLDLEADLGVDTVKQAELFAVVRDTYDIPRRDDLMLSDYNTLSKVIQYVMDSLGDVTAPQAEPVLEAIVEKAPSADKTHSEAEIEAHVVGLVSEKT